MTTVRCDEPGCPESATRHWSTYARGALIARRHTCKRHEARAMSRQDHDDLHGRPAAKPTTDNRTLQARANARPRSAVGQALHVHGEAVDHVDALYLQHAGEVTDETEAAEAARDVSARDAAEHVARYLRWLDDQEAAVVRERERLAGVEQRLAKRRQWAEGHALTLLETLAPGKSKATVGTFTLSVRRSTAVETGEGFDVQVLPPAWQRVVPEKITPARVEIDRKAAGADMLLGYREGEPPCAGRYDVEGHGRVWMSREPAHGGWAWRLALAPGQIGAPLDEAGLSIEPRPGLDVLRWKPSPPGVSLVRRCHVKVG